MRRRHFLQGLAALPFCLGSLGLAATGRAASAWEEERLGDQIKALELDSGGKLGISLRHPTRGLLYSLHGNERFPLCSTFKVILAGAVLARAVQDPALLARAVPVTDKDMVPYSPVTERHVGGDMTVEALCAAAMTLSDNTAANLLLHLLGGPQAVRSFAWSTLKDPLFRLDRLEPDCNAFTPGDPRDTTTPDAMSASLDTLLFKDVLPAPQRDMLLHWMRTCRTGEARIRAGAPEGWQVGNRSGSGDYGITNDVALLQPPQGEPLILALYYRGPAENSPRQEELLAETTRLLCAYRW